MNKTRGWPVVWGSVAAVTLILFSLSCCTTGTGSKTTLCDGQAHDDDIDVGNVVSCKAAHLSKKAGNKITWHSRPGTKLEIVFDDSAIFPNLKCPSSNLCESGPVGEKVVPGTYYYKVWLTENGNHHEIDPGVIIHD